MVNSMKDRERGCKDALVRGRQKINERRENTGNNMNRHENPKTNAKEEVYEEKKQKGPKAKFLYTHSSHCQTPSLHSRDALQTLSRHSLHALHTLSAHSPHKERVPGVPDLMVSHKGCQISRCPREGCQISRCLEEDAISNIISREPVVCFQEGSRVGARTA